MLTMPTTPTLTASVHHGKARYRARWRCGGRQHTEWFDGTERQARRAFASWMRTWKKDSSVRDPSAAARAVTVRELCQRYLDHVKLTYRKGGEATSTAWKVKMALDPLAELVGDKPAASMNPPELAKYRDKQVIGPGGTRCRSTVNAMVGIVKRAWAWGSEQGLVSAECAIALTVVSGLRQGSNATEPRKIESVAKGHVTAAVRHMSPTIRAMVWLQWWSGMRPQEVCLMRPCDIDRAGPVWLYRPHRHKTEAHGARVIALGPRCQAILRDWLARTGPASYLFQPREQEHTRSHKTHYDHNAYRRAITRACDRADAVALRLETARVPNWHPNQLRHSRATAIQRSHGLDAARAVLGHSKANTTTIYLDRDVAAAVEVARLTG